MISICIPVYNFPVSPLVEELSRQMSELGVESELILLDDGSSLFREENAAACQKHTYLELTENRGRSRIRNLFLEFARFDYLLFLDCDSLIISRNFLVNYIQELENNPFVIAGGRIYPAEQPGKEKMLSWKYGVYRESKPASERQKNPARSFMTNNFVIRKSLFEQIPFDESLSGYGHEDTLFGLELMERKIPVTQIENPVLNGDIETNENFLRKTEEGIRNLVSIEQKMENPARLQQNVALLAFYKRLKARKILGLVLFFCQIFKNPIRRSLEKGNVSLILFNLYKLGYYASLKK
ncbi:MAG: rhamnosyltransferase [Crocinitomicaceae bacterium]|jgi:glycosyltransferase involved in cell wall biosynthesis|nr:rhamnosyltransferase [Crocinitomicaceae bacterium]